MKPNIAADLGLAPDTVIGLTLASTTSDIYLACMESVVYEMRLNMKRLRDAGVEIRALRATGGARSEAWMQMKADILANHKEKCIMDALRRDGPTLSKDLKKAVGFGGESMKGFDTAITRLQMQACVTVHRFEYSRDKRGKLCGWGAARYAVTEDVLGEETTQSAYSLPPERRSIGRS